MAVARAASPEPGSLGVPVGASSEQGVWGCSPLRTPQALTRGSGGRSREWQRVPFHVSCARHLTERLTQPGTGASHHFCSKVLSKG